MTLPLTIRIILTGGLMSVVVLAFGFRADATGYTFAMGTRGTTFDLRIDSKASWNGVLQPSSTWTLKNLKPYQDKFFNLDDVKPGDTGEATISLHVNKDAWICLDFERLTEAENGRNEPEMEVDNSGGANTGELADGTEFFAWYDDGDNIFEIGEIPIFGTSTDKQAATITLNQKTYALADSITQNPFPANQTRYIGILWCAGDLQVDLPSAQVSCDGTAMGNEAQTDSFSVDISFRAVPSRDNTRFTCSKIGTKCEYSCNACGGPVRIDINNNATVISTTTSNTNTGGNSAGSGGVVITGDATSIASSTNIINRIMYRFR